MTDSTLDPDLAVRLIDAANAVYGQHAGRRALHARGQGVTGTFTASGAAAGLTTAAHLTGGEVPVVGRVSLGSGKPEDPDGAHAPRGMAIRLQTAAGNHDLVFANSPVFLTPTPELFAEFLVAAKPDPATGAPDLDKLFGFLGEHPVAAANATARLQIPIPASYADIVFYGIHAFGLVGPGGQTQWVKFHWQPVAPGGTAEPLTDEEGAAKAVDYLSTELAERMAAGPVEWDLVARLGQPEDSLVDPSVDWPEDREAIVVGRLALTGTTDAEAMIFDPTRVVDGIVLSADAVLAARGPAYGESYRRRT